MVSARSARRSSWVSRKIGSFIGATVDWCNGRGSISAIAFEVGVDAVWLLRFLQGSGLADGDGHPAADVCGRPVTPELVISALALYWLGRVVATRTGE